MFTRKRGLLALGAALAAGVLAAVALGQEAGPIRITATVKVTPDKAGTASHPRGVRIVARATSDAPGNSALSMPRSFDVWLPKSWVYNGAKAPTCASATLQDGGPSACPPGSIMGGGELGYHGEGDGDTTFSLRNLTIINGGRTKVHFWVVLHNPARVQAPMSGRITEVKSPRWSYRLHADIPSSLQVVAGIPVALNFFRASFGRGDWIATTGCPRDQRWRYHLRMTSTSDQVLDTGGSVPCRS